MKKQEQEQGTDSTEAASERPAVSHVWASFKRTVLEMLTELWGGVGNIKNNGVSKIHLLIQREKDRGEQQRFPRAKTYSN